MSTVNFSVPEDIKALFNATFEGQNRSAIVAGLMREAVERENSKSGQPQTRPSWDLKVRPATQKKSHPKVA